MSCCCFSPLLAIFFQKSNLISVIYGKKAASWHQNRLCLTASHELTSRQCTCETETDTKTCKITVQFSAQLWPTSQFSEWNTWTVAESEACTYKSISKPNVWLSLRFRGLSANAKLKLCRMSLIDLIWMLLHFSIFCLLLLTESPAWLMCLLLCYRFHNDSRRRSCPAPAWSFSGIYDCFYCCHSTSAARGKKSK